MNIDDLLSPDGAIIGTGRSGTGYCARVVNEASPLTAGHEAWFRPPGTGDRKTVHIDASWLALPSIEDRRTWAGPVVHVVREPAATVRSLLRSELLGAHREGPYGQFALKHCPVAAEQATLVEAAVEFWVDWNTRCAAVAQLTVRLEDLSQFEGGADSIGAATLGLVGHTLGVDLEWEAAARVPRDVNTREGLPGVDYDTGNDEVYRYLGSRATQFGYARMAA